MLFDFHQTIFHPSIPQTIMLSNLKRSASALAVRVLTLTMASIAMAAALPAHAQHAGAQSPAGTITQADLVRKLDQLASELASVKAELAQVKAQQQVQQTQQAQQSPPQSAVAATGWNGGGANASPALPGAQAVAATQVEAPAQAGRAEPATVLSSYGEINYNRTTKDTANTRLDIRRFVLGLQHRINDSTKVVGEIEVEHAVASGGGDPGEVAIEQAYIEHQFTPTLSARGGLFLMPAGLLNESHEPTNFYGVERNFIETAIIPSTWREAGVQLVGNFDNGLTVQGGLSTSFDLTRWDSTSTEGRESPLGSIHQEGAQAKARNLGVFGAVNWRGVPGLLVGASVFTGNATHGQTGFAQSRVTLADVHARWTPGRWDLSTVYARGNITNTNQLNRAIVGNASLIPKTFDGWYAQAAYKLWSQGDYAFSPFARYERFNTASSFAYLGQGLTPSASDTEQVMTVGANFWLTPSVVVKADIQRFHVNKLANRVNLGLGWSF